jgi:hypothetical protein
MSSKELEPPFGEHSADFQSWKNAEKSKVAQSIQSEDSEPGLCHVHIPKNGDPTPLNDAKGHGHALQLRHPSQNSPKDCSGILGQSEMNHEHRVTTIPPVAEKVTLPSKPNLEDQALPQEVGIPVGGLPLAKPAYDRKRSLRTSQAACKSRPLSSVKMGRICYCTPQDFDDGCAAHPPRTGRAPRQVTPSAEPKTSGSSEAEEGATKPPSMPPTEAKLTSETTDSHSTQGAPPPKQHRRGEIPPMIVQLKRAKNAIRKMKPNDLLLLRKWIEQRIRILEKAKPSSVA